MDKLAAANARSTLFAQIETAAGVENAESIAAVDGVDCLWVGHFDLSSSLGIPGQFDHPLFKKAIERTVKAACKYGKAVGRLVPDVTQGVQFFRKGFDFICYSGDVWVLQTALSSAVADIRAGAAKGVAGSDRKRGGKATTKARSKKGKKAK
jgi:2-dehydro-3-deoxyglucarate aldolase/4-hydroxy-2-oxoheptanedioate aldolase